MKPEDPNLCHGPEDWQRVFRKEQSYFHFSIAVAADIAVTGKVILDSKDTREIRRNWRELLSLVLNAGVIVTIIF